MPSFSPWLQAKPRTKFGSRSDGTVVSLDTSGYLSRAVGREFLNSEDWNRIYSRVIRPFFVVVAASIKRPERPQFPVDLQRRKIASATQDIKRRPGKPKGSKNNGKNRLTPRLQSHVVAGDQGPEEKAAAEAALASNSDSGSLLPQPNILVCLFQASGAKVNLPEPLPDALTASCAARPSGAHKDITGSLPLSQTPPAKVLDRAMNRHNAHAPHTTARIELIVGVPLLPTHLSSLFFTAPLYITTHRFE
ncbi:hypothetical protein C8J57DRAFT_1502251 [Mycena rebaudengoi]|nr:hypothetical protein C8J57DRAFT_1502251 [Mycena rebaudengoi]